MSARENKNFLVPLAVAALLVLHLALALGAAAKESVTADEILHVTGGYTYWKFGDFRIHAENGVLPQRLAGLPAVLMGAPPPPLTDNIYWRTSDAAVVAHQFFYETGHDHWPMLMAARAVMAVCSLATGLLIFFWSRRLWGTAGALLSLALFVLCPNFLAHDALATSDSLAVFFLLAASGAWWRHLEAPTLRSGALSAFTLGLACVAKYSAVLLLPIFALLLVVRLALDAPGARRRWLKLAPLTIAGHVAVTWFVIWGCYNFRYTAFAPGVPPADHFIVPWETVLPTIGWNGRVVEFCRHWHLLPESFLFGYAWVIRSTAGRLAFLAGEHSLFGWTSFFPLAFWWKTPLAVLAATAGGLGVLAHRWLRATRTIAADLARVAPLAVLFLVYWAFSLTSHLNIGHRHILPTYPVLFILIGGLTIVPGLARAAQSAVIAGLVLLQGAACASTYPHFLAFFNTIAGGPANGWRLLVDSSLDWGQDLPGLKKWLDANTPNEPAFISYFGTGEPGYYGIRAKRLALTNNFKFPMFYTPLERGVYCISATMLQQAYTPVPGPWTPEREKEYQELHALVPMFAEYERGGPTRAQLENDFPPGRLQALIRQHEWLRLARLCAYLRVRPADADVGHSIFIYRLSAGEVAAATAGSLDQWKELIARAAAVSP